MSLIPDLSILIPSLGVRSAYLSRLLSVLSPQIVFGVEMIIEIDVGEKSIGEKRNSLISKAGGRYTVFVDDDDMVTKDYVQQIMVGIQQNVDAVCIQQRYFENGIQKGITIDKPGQQWATVWSGGARVFLRGVQHLDAIKREIIQQVKFDETNFGEDRRFSETLDRLGLIKTHYQVPVPIYEYYFRNRKEV